jgi:hypothetical protein
MSRVRSSRFARYAVALLVVALTAWALLISLGGKVAEGPRTRTFGGDFALNVTGALVTRAAGNPYDQSQIIAAQRTFFPRQGIRTFQDRLTKLLTWQGYPPLYFWLLQPVTVLPFKVIGSIWIAALYGLMGLGFFCILGFFGWRRRLVPTMLFMCMPQVMLQAYYGNPEALVFAVIGCALVLQRRLPLLGGALMSLAWLKPQMGVPAILLIALFYVADRRRFLLGLTLGTAGLVLVDLLATGIHPLFAWIREMRSVSQIAGGQPNMIPLVGLYADHVSASARTLIEAVVLLGALALTGATWLRVRREEAVAPARVGWLWTVWLLALPYAHFPEEMLLCIGLLPFLGRDGRRLYELGPLLALYALFGSVILFYQEPFGVQMLSFPLIGIGIALYRARYQRDVPATSVEAGPAPAVV